MESKQQTVKKAERIISLALFLVDRQTPYATYDDLIANVDGYQGLREGDPASKKLLERDITALKELGIFIERQEIDKDIHLSIDRKRSFVDDVKLSPYEVLRLRLASIAPIHDPAFMFRDELKSAITKLSGFLGGTETLELSGSEDLSVIDEQERTLVKKIDVARKAHKEIGFSYISSTGEKSMRVVRPYGLFAIGRDWYLIAFDLGRNDIREFRVDRMDKLAQKNASLNPDFELPAFDIRDYIDFPFKYGTEKPFRVIYLLPRDISREPSYLWDKADVLRFDDMPDKLVMLADARSTELAARWAIEYAPGIVPVYPESVRSAFLTGLKEAEICHD